MRGTDTPTDAAIAADPSGRASRSPISVALLAGLAFMPIVVAAGFLTGRTPPPPGDGALALRGAFDADVALPSLRPARAGD